MTARSFLCANRGRTLIEALVVTLILSIVVGITASLFAAGSRAFSRETTSVAIHGDLAGAKNVLLDDLSIAGYRPDGVASGPFVSPTTTTGNFDQLAFVGDIDSDGISELICYQVVSGELQRTVQDTASACNSASPETLATGVLKFNLTFFDNTTPNRATLSDAQVLAGGASYAQVSMEIELHARGGNITETLAGEVALRN